MTVSPAKPSQPSQPDQPTHPDKLTPETARLFAGLNIVPAREIVNSGLCLGLCGTAGSGKTVTAANIHKSQHAGKVLVLDAEAGSSSIADMPVDVATIKRWSELQDVGKEITKNGTVEFGTIIIDNMTEIANMRLQEIAGGAQPQIQHFGQCQPTSYDSRGTGPTSHEMSRSMSACGRKRSKTHKPRAGLSTYSLPQNLRSRGQVS